MTLLFSADLTSDLIPTGGTSELLSPSVSP